MAVSLVIAAAFLAEPTVAALLVPVHRLGLQMAPDAGTFNRFAFSFLAGFACSLIDPPRRCSWGLVQPNEHWAWAVRVVDL